MKDRQVKILIAFVGTFLILMTVAQAEPQDALKPLLLDLDGWNAGASEGLSMDMGTMKMVNAVREYEKGAEKLTAMVMIGNQMMAQGQLQEMNMETDEGKVKITTIDGFRVHTNYDKAGKSGGVIVFLNQDIENSCIFTCYFEGISEDDALTLAKKFDWQKMKQATGKLIQK